MMYTFVRSSASNNVETASFERSSSMFIIIKLKGPYKYKSFGSRKTINLNIKIILTSHLITPWILHSISVLRLYATDDLRLDVHDEF
ncbi:hypothetical protein PILCRDRAFT_830047 [Piloderma croceum F 1598]|uniref:Uncharacterized protein n=1 Tax=Piloderma croceum (strain F 1598) TaxID=765440 RepID=A0A0C3EH29_PILCF|nr:hypothetical protein PILCRDRAFT_830047 [Piloderma croceum F 1598]